MAWVGVGMSKLAWAGELLLLEARWTDKDGHTVKFRLVTPNEERPNPFKAFTKRRSGKAGTRFHMSAAHVVSARTPTTMAYDGEAMLAGWSDTNSTGYCVTFWVQPREYFPAIVQPEIVPDAADIRPGAWMQVVPKEVIHYGSRVHPFEGFTRNVDSFMVALVELGDDEVAIDQEKRDRVEEPAIRMVPIGEVVVLAGGGGGGGTPAMQTTDKAEWPYTEVSVTLGEGEKREHKPQRLSTVAALMCNNQDFQKWIGASNTDQAAHWMRTKLGIASRSELDDPSKAEIVRAFHEQIRRPFADSTTPQGYRRA